MNKKKLVIDLDNTLLMSSKCSYQLHTNKTDYHTNHGWDFEGLLPIEELGKCLSWFSRKEFYDTVEVMEDSIEVLKELNDKYEIIIVTKGHIDSIPLKHELIKRYFPFIDRVVYLEQNSMKKDVILCDIVIDDHLTCLDTINATYKLCYGDYGYNQKSKYPRVTSWKEIRNILEFVEV